MSRELQVLHRPDLLKGPASRYRATITAISTAAAIVLIPVAPLAYLLSRWHQQKFYDRLEVLLTRRDLVVRMGVWNRQEKSIPLEKITDVALLEGPIMRAFGVKGLRVETAGQVSGPMGLVNLVGIENPEDFRDRILEQRDRVSEGSHEGNAGALAPPAASTLAAQGGAGLGQGPVAADPRVVALLEQIRDELGRLNRDRA